MTKISETITFFGSGPVAAKALILLANSFNIEAVVTKPQPEHHSYTFPVIETAKKLNLKIKYAATKQELTELFKSKPFKSKLGVVIDYGIIISRDVIAYFPLGIINSHFSLLPQWRGADPISFAILNGDKRTGVSLMLINEALDEGQLLAQKAIPLSKDINATLLTDKLIAESNQLLKDVVPSYIAGRLMPYPQKGIATYSRKLTKQDAELDFSKPAEVLEREIRAYIEWPRSRTKLGKHSVIVTKAHVSRGQGNAGGIIKTNDELGIYTSKDTLMLDKVLPFGKREMPIKAFLAGYEI